MYNNYNSRSISLFLESFGIFYLKLKYFQKNRYIYIICSHNHEEISALHLFRLSKAGWIQVYPVSHTKFIIYPIIHVFRLGIKVGVMGAACYYTTKAGLWGDSGQTERLYKELYKMSLPYLKQAPVEVSRPKVIVFILCYFWVTCYVLSKLCYFFIIHFIDSL